MAFTNTWDDTYPSDKSGIANQLGVYLRNMKTDTQQRLAAISGSAGGSFSSDAQAAQGNWNGLLFFAVGRTLPATYQFKYPQFGQVSGLTGPGLFGRPLHAPLAGTVNKTLMASAIVPPGAIRQTSRVRATVALQAAIFGPETGYQVEVDLSNGTVTTVLARGFVTTVGATGLGYIWGGQSTPGVQTWIAANPQGTVGVGQPSQTPALGCLQLFSGSRLSVGDVVNTSFNLATDTLVFQLYIQPSNTADQYDLYLWSVEVQ